MFQKPFLYKPLTTFALGALVGLTFAAPLATAQTAEEKGLAIIQEADSRDDGYSDSMATMKMVLTRKSVV